MWGPLILALLYFVMLTGWANWFLHDRIKTMAGFSMGGQTFTQWPATQSLTLAPHGSRGVMSLGEAAWKPGASVYWRPMDTVETRFETESARRMTRLETDRE